MIVMVVAAEKSEFGGGVPVFTDVNTGQVITAPVKELATAISTVSVPNGQTVVMGGMITKSDETIERKVPWLGDIPWLGVPFRYDGTTTRRGELLIFLTPRIIYNDADSELIKQVEAERLHFLEQEAEEIHGPIYSVPAESRRMSPGFLIQEHQGPTGLMPPPFKSPPASPPALQPEESPSDVPPPPAATDGSLLPDETSSTDRSRDAGPWDLSRTNRQRRGETEKSDSRQRMQQMPVAKQTPASRPAKRKRGRSVLSRLVPMLPSR